MKLTSEQDTFLKENKEMLFNIFNTRIDELKENMVLADEPTRNQIANMIVEFRYWLRDIKITKPDKKIKKDNGI